MKTLQLKLNTELKGHLAGKVITVEIDRDGTPLDSFWARRIKDSTIDNCVEIVEDRKVQRAKKNEEGTEMNS